MATWIDESQRGGDIFGQVFDANGQAVGQEFPVNTSIIGAEVQPSVSSLDFGGFVVTWRSGSDIFGRVFSGGGTPLDNEFLVDATVVGDPGVTALVGGGFLVTWTDNAGGSSSIHGRIFDVYGQAVGNEFVVDPTNTTGQFEPSVIGLDAGGFLVTWTDVDQGTISGQIFNSPPALSVADVDDTNIESATVAITSGFALGEDVLGFTAQNGITGEYDSQSGVLTLTGTATLADYETAFQSVTYENTSDDPSTATRTLSFTVYDGEADSNTVTREITITPVNDAPVAVDDAYSVDEDQTLAVAAAGVLATTRTSRGTHSLRLWCLGRATEP